ncbi:STAS domain-containing protein [Geodermatophilus marinus]|uniref:STAS domain-containing protein n=1 Tax=Geodermatophilus sp. LHW52908 TaxID=2303986 RepID=UPI0013140D85|nr:STAS domain-containing protein [Geodermatophilus sp. LHW52908]
MSVDLRGGRVQVRGELDRSTAHHLLDALVALGLTDHPVWTVDASHLSFCDTTGLRALAQGAARARGSGRRLRVTGACPVLAEVVALAGLGDVLAERRPAALPAPRGPGSVRG